MEGQMTFADIRKHQFFDRNGHAMSAPEWANEQRCGNCIYWQRLSKDEQAPAGWGVKGACGSYRGKGQFMTSQTSYCQDWHEKPAWEQ